MQPLLCVFLALLAALQEKREPVPSPADQKGAEKLIREIYKDDYAKKAPGDRVELAGKLLSQSPRPTNDAPTRYMLLKEAQELAVLAGDARLAVKVISEWGRRFEVDAATLKFAALQALAKGAKTSEEARPIAGLFLDLADEALASDGYDLADKSADGALPLARKAKELALISRADGKKKEIAERRTVFDAVVKARAALAKDGSDGPANRIVGYHLCAKRGEWDAGLPFLAKGDDTELKALAGKDLANPAAPEERVAVADGWWDRAEKCVGAERRNGRLRAAFWYGKSLDGPAGPLQSRARLRVTEIREENPAAPRVWVALDDPRHFGNTRSTAMPIEMVPTDTFVTLPFRDLPPGEYDGVSARITIRPPSIANANFSFEAGTRMAQINANLRKVSLIHLDTNIWTSDFIRPVGNQEEFILTLLVERGEYIVLLDGVEIGRCPTPQTRLLDLMLRTNYGPALFDRIRIRRAD